ncbi:uncharacterized protein DS421_4g130650 [Arachis hypogaea]|nr:uncharacterized protein DS421_4g130650 [Arachis hypogaea]
MCCNNFHIVIFSGCHLTTAVVFFSGNWSFHVKFLCCDCIYFISLSKVFSQGGMVSYSQQVVSELRFGGIYS